MKTFNQSIKEFNEAFNEFVYVLFKETGIINLIRWIENKFNKRC